MITLFKEERSSSKRYVRTKETEPHDTGTISRKVSDDDADGKSRIYDAARLIFFNARQRQYRKPSAIF